MRNLAILLLLAGCVQTPEPDRYEAAVIAALRDNNCQFVGGPGGDDRRFAEVLSPYLGVSAEALLDRNGPHYDAIDQAIQGIIDREEVILEDDPRVVTLKDCP